MPSSSPWYTYGVPRCRCRSVASIVAERTRCSGRRRPSARRCAAGRGCTSTGCSSPSSARPACQRPNDALRSRRSSGRGCHLLPRVVEADVLELEHHVDLAAGRIGEQHGVVDRDAGHLADRERRRRRVRRTRRRASRAGTRGSAGRRCTPPSRRRSGPPPIDRPVGQRRVLGQHVDDVHAEAVDAAVEPPAHHRVHGLADRRLLPVQVGLLAREEVQVVLAARLVELPRRPGEERRASSSARPRAAPATMPVRGGRHQYQSRCGRRPGRRATRRTTGARRTCG